LVPLGHEDDILQFKEKLRHEAVHQSQAKVYSRSQNLSRHPFTQIEEKEAKIAKHKKNYERKSKSLIKRKVSLQKYKKQVTEMEAD
jgi:hypothetical protein